jgi:hypothetical protein
MGSFMIPWKAGGSSASRRRLYVQAECLARQTPLVVLDFVARSLK